MTKPLELNVYWTVPCGGPCRCESYVLPGDDLVAIESVNVEAKRFTDAELAAEYWESTYDREVVSNWSGSYDRIQLSGERREIMHRFATLPHYDEPTP